MIVKGEYENSSDINNSLKITHIGNYMYVGGDFNISTTGSNDGCLTDGLIEIGGNFYQSGDSNNFNVSDGLTVKLSGSGDQYVYMEDSGVGYGHFSNLVISKESGSVILESDVYVTKYLITNSPDIINLNSYDIYNEEGNVYEVKNIIEEIGFTNLQTNENEDITLNLNTDLINDLNLSINITNDSPEVIDSIEYDGNGSVVFYVKSDAYGSAGYSVEIVYNDLNCSETFELNVIENKTPTIEVPDEIVLNENFGEFNLSVYVNDYNGDDLTLKLFEDNNLTNYPAEINLTQADYEQNVTISLTSKDNIDGNDTLHITVSDGDNNITTSIPIIINKIIYTPQIAISDIDIYKKETNFSVNTVNNENAILKISVDYPEILQIYPNEINITNDGNNTVDIVLNPLESGFVKVKFTLIDSNETIEKEIYVNIQDSIKIIPSKTIINTDENVTFNVDIYDDEFNSSSIIWKINYEEVNTSSSFTYQFKEPGNYIVKCIAGDNENNVTDSVLIKVLNNNLTYNILSGWNFLSLPAKGHLDYYDVKTLFNGIAYIYKYHNGWMLFDNEEVKDVTLDKFTTINSNEGFIIYSDNNFSITYPVDLNENNTTDIGKFYTEGWHLIGVNDDMSVDEYINLLSLQGYKLVAIWQYVNNEWQFYSPNIALKELAKNKGYPTFNELSRFLGYWIYIEK